MTVFKRPENVNFKMKWENGFSNIKTNQTVGFRWTSNVIDILSKFTFERAKENFCRSRSSEDIEICIVKCHLSSESNLLKRRNSLNNTPYPNIESGQHLQISYRLLDFFLKFFLSLLNCMNRFKIWTGKE